MEDLQTGELPGSASLKMDRVVCGKHRKATQRGFPGKESEAVEVAFPLNTENVEQKNRGTSRITDKKGKHKGTPQQGELVDSQS